MKTYLVRVEPADSGRADVYQVRADSITGAHVAAEKIISEKYQTSGIDHVSITAEGN